MKWTNAVGKMAPLVLPNTGLPQTVNLKNAISTKHNKMRYAYNMISSIYSETCLFTEIVLNLFLTEG